MARRDLQTVQGIVLQRSLHIGMSEVDDGVDERRTFGDDASGLAVSKCSDENVVGIDGASRWRMCAD